MATSEPHRSSNEQTLVERLRDCVKVTFSAGLHGVESDCRQAADELDRQRAQIERLTKALRIVELKASGTLANNLCSDHRDKQTGKPCLACEVERLTRENERYAAWACDYDSGVAADRLTLVELRGERDRLARGVALDIRLLPLVVGFVTDIAPVSLWTVDVSHGSQSM